MTQTYPVSQKFCQNRFILHRLQDKCFLCRNSRWLPKWQENDFWTKLPGNSTDALVIKNSVDFVFLCLICFFHLCTNSIYLQKWLPKMIFAKKLQMTQLHPGGQKFSEIKAFLQKFIWRKLPDDSRDTLGVKNFVESLYLAPFLR